MVRALYKTDCFGSCNFHRPRGRGVRLASQVIWCACWTAAGPRGTRRTSSSGTTCRAARVGPPIDPLQLPMSFAVYHQFSCSAARTSGPPGSFGLSNQDRECGSPRKASGPVRIAAEADPRARWTAAPTASRSSSCCSATRCGPRRVWGVLGRQNQEIYKNSSAHIIKVP